MEDVPLVCKLCFWGFCGETATILLLKEDEVAFWYLVYELSCIWYYYWCLWELELFV